jgi:hypothetical protein
VEWYSRLMDERPYRPACHLQSLVSLEKERGKMTHEPQGHEEYFFKGCLYALAIYAIIAALAVGAYFLGRWIIMLALAGA